MILLILLILAVPVALLVSLIVLFDRTSRLDYRLKILEQQLKEGTAKNQEISVSSPLPAPQESALGPEPSGENRDSVAFDSPMQNTGEPVAPQQVPPAPAEPDTATVAVCAAASQEKPEEIPPATTKPSAAPAKPWIDWENFTTAKLFSWIGGFTLFLGFAFWIKYSIENNLISPAMRIILSALLGTALLTTGLFIRRENLKTTAGTLCGCGLSILYASIFGAYSFYNLISFSTAFVFMAAVALLSFGVAIYKNAKYVGFLAEVISFLTPFILSGGGENYIFFFSYVAFINAAAAITALTRRWNGLLIGACIFTFLCQIAAAAHILSTQAGTFAFFCALYTAAAVTAAWKYKDRISKTTQEILAFFTVGGFMFICAALNVNDIHFSHALTWLALGLWLNILLAFLAYRQPDRYAFAFIVGKVFVFIALCLWIRNINNQPLLTLTTFLAFSAVNAAPDLLLYKKQGASPSGLAIILPGILMLPLLFSLPQANAQAFGAAFILMAVFVALSALFAALNGKILSALGACIAFIIALIIYVLFRPAAMPSWIILTMAFIPSLLIAAVARYAVKQTDKTLPLTLFATALMPYILISIMSAGQDLPIHLLMGFTLAFNLLCAFFVYVYRNGKPLLAALCGSTLLQLIQTAQLQAGEAQAFIYWTLGIFFCFAAYPFFFKKRFLDDTAAWICSALSGVVASLLIYVTMRSYFVIAHPGLLPLGFALLYAAAVYKTVSWQPLTEGIQRTRLALLGGVTLFFVTLVFPLELSKAWLTAAWALEGAALVYLNRFLHHPGLTRTGFALLLIVFVRLVLNPEINSYYPVENKIFNWYLYVFGLAGAMSLLAAHWWQPKEESRFRAWLKAVGGILLFLLMNIEIASYFSVGGKLSFDIFGSFNSAIAYTVGWTLFGAACLLLGANNKSIYTKRTGIILIALALLKLFFSDIWALGGLYRVFGLFGVAAVLMVLSFIYQRFRQLR